MSQMKLFGTSHHASRVATKVRAGKGSRQKKPLKGLAIFLTVLLILEGLYFLCCYSNIPFIRKYRTIYINTAMSTMTHQWLATAFLPEDVISQARFEYGDALSKTVGVETDWGGSEAGGTSSKNMNADVQSLSAEDEDAAKEAFYTLFWELDRDSFDAYVEENPDVLANGWENIHINQAGFDESGIDAYTTFDEQVLGLDAKTGILLVRVEGSGYRGVLAIAKQPELLSVELSAYLGSSGQTCGDIASSHDGILAMNCSAFWDEDASGNQGAGNGGILAGYTMSNSEGHGTHFGSYAYKRMELHEDNRMYIKDAYSAVSNECTDAMEFSPAMIVDGEQVIDYGYTGTQPRSCIGQSDKYEILMLCIEGRQTQSAGTDVNTCASILLKHNCMQAINQDGGSSAMIWFDGKCAISSSSTPLRYSGGRPLPNAWVVHNSGWTEN